MDEDRQKIEQRLIKLLRLKNNYAATIGEKASAEERIKQICEKFNYRIDGNKIIRIGDPVEEEPKGEPDYYGDPKRRVYVLYKGKKYYGGVPKSVWQQDEAYQNWVASLPVTDDSRNFPSQEPLSDRRPKFRNAQQKAEYEEFMSKIIG